MDRRRAQRTVASMDSMTVGKSVAARKYRTKIIVVVFVVDIVDNNGDVDTIIVVTEKEKSYKFHAEGRLKITYSRWFS